MDESSRLSQLDADIRNSLSFADLSNVIQCLCEIQNLIINSPPVIVNAAFIKLVNIM
jgi:hypothetical protein